MQKPIILNYKSTRIRTENIFLSRIFIRTIQKIKRVLLLVVLGKTTITSMILHVMHYHDIAVDYMVGAQLEGFDTMVHLTEENDFIVLKEMNICLD
jgi:UDP-N-acetylmuramate-alanine ligase